jgi:hypothetical protein
MKYLNLFSEKTALITLIAGCSIHLMLGEKIIPTLSEKLKITSGLILLALISFQSVLLLKKLLKITTSKTDLRLHKLTSYLSLIFFFLHVQSFGHGWTKAMLIIFILTAISAVFSKGFVKHKSRNSILRQYFFHIVMGSALIFMVLPHALIATLFE